MKLIAATLMAFIVGTSAGVIGTLHFHQLPPAFVAATNHDHGVQYFRERPTDRNNVMAVCRDHPAFFDKIPDCRSAVEAHEQVALDAQIQALKGHVR